MSASSDCAAWSRVSVVAVTHHSAGVVGPCLTSVSKAAQVIIIDNASDDGTPELVRRTLPSVELIENRIGRGFGNGANQGLARVTSEFALLIGPDSTISDEAVERLVAAADAYSEAGMLGPAIIAPDGHVEPSHNWSLFQRIGGGKRSDEGILPEGPLCANHLSGAVLLVRMSAYATVGGFDRNIYLYYEDDDLCMRMGAAGYALVLVPEARATHVGGGSSRPSPWHRWEKFWHMSWSRHYIEAKYHGRAAGLASAVRYAPRHLGKALLYGLTFNRKGWRDLARFAGTLAWVLGVQAMPKGTEGES